MFTGIIEEIGQMKHISRRGQAMVLNIQAERILEDVHLGDSIAVNGVCLTVTAYDNFSIAVDVMPETYRKTTLKQLAAGSKVNLERAMSMQGRFGGHIVQGHVDGIGHIRHREQEENAVVFKIVPEDETAFQYIIDRGSITIDGISLTVVKAEADFFTVSIIPHTLKQTILRDKQAGDTVNIECDLLGKYVNHLLHYRNESKRSVKSDKEKLTRTFLSENGFL
jgi:riboflavin synthase